MYTWPAALLPDAIKTHGGGLLTKLRVGSRGQATVQALKRGLLCLDELT